MLQNLAVKHELLPSPTFTTYWFKINFISSPLFNSTKEVLETFEWRSGTPNAKPDHVRHVLRFGSSGCRSVNDPCFGQQLLELHNGKTGLGRLTAVPSSRTGVQVFSAMALVEDDAAVEVISAPVDELLKTTFVLTSVLAALADESGVCRIKDALVDVAIERGVDLAVLHLLGTFNS